MMIRQFKTGIFQSRYTLFPICKMLFLYTWRKHKLLGKKGLEGCPDTVCILCMCLWGSVAWKWKQDNSNCLHRCRLKTSQAFYTLSADYMPIVHLLNWHMELFWGHKEGSLQNSIYNLEGKWHRPTGGKRISLMQLKKLLTTFEIKTWSGWCVFTWLLPISLTKSRFN